MYLIKEIGEGIGISNFSSLENLSFLSLFIIFLKGIFY